MRKFKKRRIISAAALIICLALMTSCKKDKAADEPADSGQITQEENTGNLEDDTEQEGEPSETEDESDAEAGIEDDKSQPDTEDNKTQEPADDKSANAAPSVGSESAKDKGNNAQRASDTTISIYGIDANTMTTQPIKADLKKGEQITAETIVDKVVDALAADNLNIKIDKITQNVNTVTVSFKSGSAPLVDLGSSEESAVLDCISMSLLDNLEACKYIVFQADGGPYVSGHFEYGENDAYMWKK